MENLDTQNNTPEVDPQPTPEIQPAPTPEPETPSSSVDPVKGQFSLEDVKDLLVLLGETKAPAIEPEAPTVDPQPETENLETYKAMLTDILIEVSGVPEELKTLVPKDPLEAKKFLSSEAYVNLSKRLSLVSKPLTPETPSQAPETPTTPDPVRSGATSDKKKTFDDFDSSAMANLLKEIL